MFDRLFSTFFKSTNNINNNFDSFEMGEKTFVCKKLQRFIFPKEDKLDPKWIFDKIPQFHSLLHIIYLSWTRLSEEELNTWNQMCGRNVADKEVSNEGIFKTTYDLRVDRNNFKREQQKINLLRVLKMTKLILIQRSNLYVPQKT